MEERDFVCSLVASVDDYLNRESDYMPTVHPTVKHEPFNSQDTTWNQTVMLSGNSQAQKIILERNEERKNCHVSERNTSSSKGTFITNDRL